MMRQNNKTNTLKDEIEKFISLIEQSSNFLIAAHANPDGDSISSQLALALVLTRIKKKVRIWSVFPVPFNYTFLPGKEYWKTPPYNKNYKSDVIIILDSTDEERLDNSIVIKMRNTSWIINLDHHISNKQYADINIVDVKASSCGEIIYGILKRLGIEITKDIAECIYVSMLTDTGGFRYRNTTTKVHRIIAELMETGIPVEKIFNNVYGNIPIKKIRLLTSGLNSLFFAYDNRVSGMILTREMFYKTGSSDNDVEGLIDSIRIISGVEIALLFIESVKKNIIKISLRSNNENLDVNKLAKKFGGGGHPTASGAKVKGTLDKVKKEVLKEVEKEFYSGSQDKKG